MKKLVYDNATIYITIPSEEQKENIKKATKVFMEKIIKEQGSKWNKQVRSSKI